MYSRLKETYNKTISNIYGEPLKRCGNSKMGSGSWDKNYMCSEKDGGVHQICVDSIGKNTNKFSKNTGQTDWSTRRGKNNHCVCLGAWSLYNSKKKMGELNDNKNKKLICEAIPEYSLSNRYVNKFSNGSHTHILYGNQGWERWNNLEYNNQIIDGVESMVNECYNSGNTKQRENLRQRYCRFAKGVEKLNTDFYNEMCYPPS